MNNSLPVNLQMAKKLLIDMFQEVWREQVEEKPKLRTYKLFKKTISPEAHLRATLPKLNRSLLSQLHCGTLPLQIESGHFQRLLASERTCELCVEEPETEFHFLFKCNKLKEVRLKWCMSIPELKEINDATEKFEILTNMPYHFSNFILDLWKERAKILSLNLNVNW